MIQHSDPDLEITTYENLLLGLANLPIKGVDITCAKIEFAHLIQNPSPQNPFLLQHKRYYLPDTLRRKMDKKFADPSLQGKVGGLQEDINALDLVNPNLEGNSLALYQTVMDLATEGFADSIIPIAAICYFLRILVFKYLKFNTSTKYITLFRYLIVCLAQHGWSELQPTDQGEPAYG